MRHARLTWIGAYHHVMNRGVGDEKIFLTREMKVKYLKLLEEKSKLLRIKIYCFCLMDNHFHLILENSAGRLSDFMKQLNTSYALFYRKRVGGKGYVFQNRFQSTLIQNESYLIIAIKYVLQNPVNAGIISDFLEYEWSSARYYFSKENHPFLDTNFVEDSFGSVKIFQKSVNNFDFRSVVEYPTKFGSVLGKEEFIKEAENKYDRRQWKSLKENKRESDMYFEPVDKVYYEFEKTRKIRLSEIDFSTHRGKRLRGEFLVLLKDKAGLLYREIKELVEFSDINFSSLGNLYSKNKQRLLKEKKQKNKDRP
jgi:REP element-mobilizing transposase RayT